MGDPGCWAGGFRAEVCCDAAAGPKGNPSCWNEVFTHERCCAPAAPTAPPPSSSCWSEGFGPELCCQGGGHPLCWDGVYTFDRCCPEAPRAVLAWWLLPCHPGCLPSWSSEAQLILGCSLLLVFVLHFVSICRAGKWRSWASNGFVEPRSRHWAPDAFRVLCLCCQICIHYMQTGVKDGIHPKHVELVARHLDVLSREPWSQWTLLWLQRSIHSCATSGWYVLSAYLLSRHDVPNQGVASLWLRKLLRQAPSTVLGGIALWQVSGELGVGAGRQVLELFGGLTRDPSSDLRYEMACWLTLALCTSPKRRLLRYLCLAAVAFVLAHICFQACRVYNLVAVSYVPSDRSLAFPLLLEFLPMYLLAFLLSQLPAWHPLPPICGLVVGVLGTGLLSVFMVDNVGGAWPPYVNPLLHGFLDLPLVVGSIYFLKASEYNPRFSSHLLGVVSTSSLMAQQLSHRLLLQWLLALRGDARTSMVDAFLSIPGVVLLSLLLAYVLTVLVGIPSSWLIGKLATPWFHRAPNAFFASYLAVFGSYLVFEEEVFSISARDQVFRGECPVAAYVKEPRLLTVAAWSAMPG